MQFDNKTTAEKEKGDEIQSRRDEKRRAKKRWEPYEKKPSFESTKEGFGKIPAATYSPTQLPVQYHRRWRA